MYCAFSAGTVYIFEALSSVKLFRTGFILSPADVRAVGAS